MFFAPLSFKFFQVCKRTFFVCEVIYTEKTRNVKNIQKTLDFYLFFVIFKRNKNKKGVTNSAQYSQEIRKHLFDGTSFPQCSGSQSTV